jgi:hypothetical protein
VKILALVVPGDIRREFTANLLADRRDMQARGVSPLLMSFALCRELLAGFAQYAPLRPVVAGTSPKPRVAERAGLGGWISWRIAGPALFIGYILGSTLLLVLGGLLLAGAFGCLVTVASTATNPMPESQRRLVASVLGGTLATLLLIVFFGAATMGVLAIGSIFSSGLLMGLATTALVLVATSSLAIITGSGWVPEEYDPKRLVVNEELVHEDFELPVQDEVGAAR